MPTYTISISSDICTSCCRMKLLSHIMRQYPATWGIDDTQFVYTTAEEYQAPIASLISKLDLLQIAPDADTATVRQATIAIIDFIKLM